MSSDTEKQHEQKTKHVPLSEAIKKIYDKQEIENAIKNALASLEVEGQTLSEGAIQLIKKRLSGNIPESEFLQLARLLAKTPDVLPRWCQKK